MLHGFPQDVNVLSKEETQLLPDSLHVDTRNFNGISMDCTDQSYPMWRITCKWCKKKKSCEHFEQYRKAYRYHKACNDCRQLYCKFCGHSFKSRSKAADPPRYPVCKANECKRRSAIKPRSCCNASCIHHKSKVNPWILNDNGETTFNHNSSRHFSAQCRRCQQMKTSDVKKNENGVPIITCRWCRKEKPRNDFEHYGKKKRYHKACNDCRQLYCRFCGNSFKSKSRKADPPNYPACEAKECKRRFNIKPRNCSNASCIYHTSKINPWILNDNGETTFDNGGPTFEPRGHGHFSAECRRCQQMSCSTTEMPPQGAV